MEISDDLYSELARVLNTLPNGFPSTESGVEIRLLKKVFTPEQAELFCRMKISFETADQIALRTERPVDDLERLLVSMWRDGQIFAIQMGDTWFYKILPWIFGIYEFQVGRLDREFAELNDEYMPAYSRQFFSNTPQLMQVLPIEEEVVARQEALPYEKVSTLIEQGQSFIVYDCVCKKEQGLLNKPCDRPVRVCLGIASVLGVFQDSSFGHVLTRDEAYELLKKTEELGLVHMTNNLQFGHLFICNCCKCCCAVLGAINKLGIPAKGVVNSHYYAEIDPDQCSSCGLCADERCQVGAIEEGEDAYLITRGRCIGCGLCISTCPSEAIRLVRKDQDNAVAPPLNEDAWFEERGKRRGVDFSEYK